MTFELNHELTVPDGAWAAAVLCHPHPDYGGDMRNLVIGSLFAALVEAGAAALRFDFRGSEPEGARRDTLAAIDALAAAVDPTVPLVLGGYSFGADIALTVSHDRLAGWFLVAPPLRSASLESMVAPADPRPKRVVVPEHDRFSSPERARTTAADWTATDLDVIGGADHFLVGRSERVADDFVAFGRSLVAPK